MKKILVAGPVFSRSGYGEHARFVIDSLMTRPDLYDVYIYPLEWGLSNWASGDPEKTKHYETLLTKTAVHIQQSRPFDIHVQVTIPSEWVTDVAPYNIGITAGVETDRLPQSWEPKILQMDKVIVTSDHIKDLFEKVVKGKKDVGVTTVGYPVKEVVPTDLSKDLELPNKFNFLTVAQYAPRKNLLATIKWFVEEFRNEDVGLVVKTHMKNGSYPDWCQLEVILQGFIRTLGPRQCSLHFISGTMSDAEMHGLYRHPKIKAYVTTTHGEGFGLPIFEAAYSGLPVIAPAWSGQKDFLYAPVKKRTGKSVNTAHFEKIGFDVQDVTPEHHMPGAIEEGMKWCYPEENKCKKAMRQVFVGITLRQKTASKLQEHLCETFTVTNQHNKMCDAVGIPEAEEELIVEEL